MLGYASWYTLYQKVWGNGGSYLYWVSGSSRFAGPVQPRSSSSSQTITLAGHTITLGQFQQAAGQLP